MRTPMNSFEDFIAEETKNFHLGNLEEKKIIEDIVNYFTIGPTSLDRSKGILLRGCIGGGKTITMKAVQRWLSQEKKFSMYSCNDVTSDFNLTGDNAYEKYSGKKHILFDDLGAEDLGRYYGNQVEALEKLIMKRYELFTDHGIKTHFTSNLSNIDIEKKYGQRVYDRLKEMINIVVWPAKASKRGGPKVELNYAKPRNLIEDISPEQARKEFLQNCLFKPYDKAMIDEKQLILEAPVAICLERVLIEKGIFSTSPEVLGEWIDLAKERYRKPLKLEINGTKTISLKKVLSDIQKNVKTFTSEEDREIHVLASKYRVNAWILKQQKSRIDITQLF